MLRPAEFAIADQPQKLGLATLINAESLARASTAASIVSRPSSSYSLNGEGAELFNTRLRDLRHQELHQHVYGDSVIFNLMSIRHKTFKHNQWLTKYIFTLLISFNFRVGGYGEAL